MPSPFHPKIKWSDIADGGSSVNCGFEFEPVASNRSDDCALINCQQGLWIPHLFVAAIGSKNEPSLLGLTGGAAPPPD